MKRLLSTVLLCLLGFAPLFAQKPDFSGEFFPLRAGTYWVYKGTVRWYDYENDKPASGDVTWKMTVERVIHRKGVVAAIVTGFPGDLDFTAGTTEPKPWLILETENHQIYYENLGPDFDLTKLDGDDHVFDKYMADENFIFQWPLHPGAKYCDDEAKKRDDGMYCWIVKEAAPKKLDSLKGNPANGQPVFQLQYRTLPDDTTMELLPGVGLVSYLYHHHGTVADTELQLVEFHPGPEASPVQGSVQGSKP
jgi:hypothetical protein